MEVKYQYIYEANFGNLNSDLLTEGDPLTEGRLIEV